VLKLVNPEPEPCAYESEAEAMFEIELHSCEGGDVAEADINRATALKEEGNAMFKVTPCI